MRKLVTMFFFDYPFLSFKLKHMDGDYHRAIAFHLRIEKKTERMNTGKRKKELCQLHFCLAVCVCVYESNIRNML